MSDQADEIIREFREARQKIKQSIAALEIEERHLFRRMLERLQSLESRTAHPAYVRGEPKGPLD